MPLKDQRLSIVQSLSIHHLVLVHQPTHPLHHQELKTLHCLGKGLIRSQTFNHYNLRCSLSLQRAVKPMDEPHRRWSKKTETLHWHYDFRRKRK
jgi:hypothetical protein